MNPCIGHAQRIKKRFLQVFTVRLAGDLANNMAEKEKGRIVVLPFFTGVEIIRIIFKKGNQLFFRYG
jgi:hypothetical protein